METFAVDRGPPQPVLPAARDVLRQVRDQAMFLVDPQGRVASWNEGVGLLLGWEEKDWIGQPMSVAFTPGDLRAGVPEAELRTAERSGCAEGSRWMQRRNGERFFARSALTRVRDDSGAAVGYLKTLRDHITSPRPMRDRARQLKGEFLATISHELRTPLAAILGWAHVLERGSFEPDTLHQGLAAIARNARMQVQLIEDLLDMNRIESGQLRLEMQRLDLVGVVTAAVDAAQPLATAKGLRLNTVFRSPVQAVMGDPARLQQVMAKLLHNAIKFTPAGGEISVSLAQQGHDAEIAVADTGQGIAPAFLSRLFDSFEQQEVSTTRRFGGLGLGLTITRNLVRLHGGTVHAHSAGPGLGSTFTVTLPARGARRGARPETTPAAHTEDTEETEDTVASGPEDQPVRLDGLKVLLIDDEPDVRYVTACVLQRAGADVLTAADADAGLQLLRHDRPAVLLSDIGMPVADGYELIYRVRQLTPQEGGETPAAAFTAYARPEDRQRALAAGYQMHLCKPLEATALLRSVHQLAKLTR